MGFVCSSVSVSIKQKSQIICDEQSSLPLLYKTPYAHTFSCNYIFALYKTSSSIEIRYFVTQSVNQSLF